jgi:integrase
MATRNRRNEWHQVNEKWTRSLGERGMRVRLFQKRRDGTFYRTVWIPGRGRDHASMMTRDRGEAERLRRLLLAELLRQEELSLPGRLTLGAVWDRYKRECAAFLDNKPNSRRHDESRARVLLAFFGEKCEVWTLTARDQASYSARRKAGGIHLPSGETTRAVRARSVEMDLVLLHAMLSWATTVRLPNGSRLLDVNPLAGVRREREQNPVRPIASWERFTHTRKAMRQLGAAAGSELERTRWAKMELALVLAEATGRRVGSIRQLRWEDIDFERSMIRWRAEADKKGREWVVPRPCLTAPGAEAVPKATRRDRRLALRWRAEAGAADGPPPLRQVAPCRGGEGEGAEARRRVVASLPPEVGDRAKAAIAQGRGSRRRLEGHGDAAHLLPAARYRDAARRHERGAQGTRRGARLRQGLRNGTTNGTSAVDAKKHRRPTANGAFAYRIGTAGFEPATP